MSRAVKESVTLNSAETDIRNLLVKFCDFHNAKSSDKLELRITGGWVRDKLLGKESNDIDIGINTLSGEEFAMQLRQFVEQTQPELSMKGIHKIKKNPAKSKHLETCSTKLFGLDIDFVNLRSEQYTEDSRVPVIEYGTAEEDALRRDATLNALFYNLNEDKIEDFTNKGLDDLRNGILRTPLAPLQTFLDDPLRVLRLIRFASRFDFTIDHDTLMAMKKTEIRTALIHKISRERIGTELGKILLGPNPAYGMNLINYTGLSQCIFNAGTLQDTIFEINENEIVESWKHSESLLGSRISLVTSFLPSLHQYMMLTNTALSKIYQDLAVSADTNRLLWFAMLLQPFEGVAVQLNLKKPMLFPAVEVILKEGLRFGKHEFDSVATIVNQSPSALHTFFTDPDSLTRSQLGLYLRSFHQYANLNLVYRCFNEIINHYKVQESSDVPNPNPPLHELDDTSKALVVNYDRVVEHIREWNLEDVDSLKPIVDGKSLAKHLDRKPGPWMAAVTSEVLVWQLDHPDGTQDECIEHIKLTCT